MLRLACLSLVLIGTAFAAEPTRCCFDKQYSVLMGDVGEVLADDADTSYFIDGYIRMGFDYYRDRQAMYTVFKNGDGSYNSMYQLKDYVSRRVYLSTNNLTTCTYTDLPPFDIIQPSCMPDNATFVGSYTFGYGANSLKVHTWSFPYQMSYNRSTDIYFSVTQDHCVPVTEAMIGDFMGTPIEQTLFFVDYHPGIEHLRRLEIPTGCTEAITPLPGRK